MWPSVTNIRQKFNLYRLLRKSFMPMLGTNPKLNRSGISGLGVPPMLLLFLHLVCFPAPSHGTQQVQQRLSTQMLGLNLSDSLTETSLNEQGDTRTLFLPQECRSEVSHGTQQVQQRPSTQMLGLDLNLNLILVREQSSTEQQLTPVMASRPAHLLFQLSERQRADLVSQQHYESKLTDDTQLMLQQYSGVHSPHQLRQSLRPTGIQLIHNQILVIEQEGIEKLSIVVMVLPLQGSSLPLHHQKAPGTQYYQIFLTERHQEYTSSNQYSTIPLPLLRMSPRIDGINRLVSHTRTGNSYRQLNSKQPSGVYSPHQLRQSLRPTGIQPGLSPIEQLSIEQLLNPATGSRLTVLRPKSLLLNVVGIQSILIYSTERSIQLSTRTSSMIHLPFLKQSQKIGGISQYHNRIRIDDHLALLSNLPSSGIPLQVQNRLQKINGINLPASLHTKQREQQSTNTSSGITLSLRKRKLSPSGISQSVSHIHTSRSGQRQLIHTSSTIPLLTRKQQVKIGGINRSVSLILTGILSLQPNNLPPSGTPLQVQNPQVKIGGIQYGHNLISAIGSESIEKHSIPVMVHSRVASSQTYLMRNLDSIQSILIYSIDYYLELDLTKQAVGQRSLQQLKSSPLISGFSQHPNQHIGRDYLPQTSNSSSTTHQQIQKLSQKTDGTSHNLSHIHTGRGYSALNNLRSSGLYQLTRKQQLLTGGSNQPVSLHLLNIQGQDSLGQREYLHHVKLFLRINGTSQPVSRILTRNHFQQVSSLHSSGMFLPILKQSQKTDGINHSLSQPRSQYKLLSNLDSPGRPYHKNLSGPNHNYSLDSVRRLSLNRQLTSHHYSQLKLSRLISGSNRPVNHTRIGKDYLLPSSKPPSGTYLLTKKMCRLISLASRQANLIRTGEDYKLLNSKHSFGIYRPKQRQRQKIDGISQSVSRTHTGRTDQPLSIHTSSTTMVLKKKKRLKDSGTNQLVNLTRTEEPYRLLSSKHLSGIQVLTLKRSQKTDGTSHNLNLFRGNYLELLTNQNQQPYMLMDSGIQFTQLPSKVRRGWLYMSLPLLQCSLSNKSSQTNGILSTRILSIENLTCRHQSYRTSPTIHLSTRKLLPRIDGISRSLNHIHIEDSYTHLLPQEQLGLHSLLRQTYTGYRPARIAYNRLDFRLLNNLVTHPLIVDRHSRSIGNRSIHNRGHENSIYRQVTSRTTSGIPVPLQNRLQRIGGIQYGHNLGQLNDIYLLLTYRHPSGVTLLLQKSSRFPDGITRSPNLIRIGHIGQRQSILTSSGTPPLLKRQLQRTVGISQSVSHTHTGRTDQQHYIHTTSGTYQLPKKLLPRIDGISHNLSLTPRLPIGEPRTNSSLKYRSRQSRYWLISGSNQPASLYQLLEGRLYTYRQVQASRLIYSLVSRQYNQQDRSSPSLVYRMYSGIPSLQLRLYLNRNGIRLGHNLILTGTPYLPQTRQQYSGIQVHKQKLFMLMPLYSLNHNRHKEGLPNKNVTRPQSGQMSSLMHGLHNLRLGNIQLASTYQRQHQLYSYKKSLLLTNGFLLLRNLILSDEFLILLNNKQHSGIPLLQNPSLGGTTRLSNLILTFIDYRQPIRQQYSGIQVLNRKQFIRMLGYNHKANLTHIFGIEEQTTTLSNGCRLPRLTYSSQLGTPRLISLIRTSMSSIQLSKQQYSGIQVQNLRQYSKRDGIKKYRSLIRTLSYSTSRSRSPRSGIPRLLLLHRRSFSPSPGPGNFIPSWVKVLSFRMPQEVGEHLKMSKEVVVYRV